MKVKALLAIIVIWLLACCTTASADEGTYIVTLNDTVSFFGNFQENPRDYVVVTEDELNELLDAGMVEEYEPNLKAELFMENWNLDAIECSFAWDIGCYGNEVRVGVIDSGLAQLSELEGNVIEGKNYVDNSTDTTDNVGHGTFVSGIIASESVGAAYRSRIVPLKCFETGKTTYVDDLLDAIYDAVDVYNCDVINMSFGISGYSLKFHRAITYAVNNGVIVIAAVGNDGSDKIYYPAAFSNVIGVGSVGEACEWSEFSQYNSSVFVTAPGEDIIGLGASGYMNGSGTSFSAPHVTALAAVAKCVDKSIDTEKFMSLLSESSVDMGDAGYDVYYGYGVINFKSFLSELLKNTDMFISPLYVENNKAVGVIYNNSQTSRDINCISVSYIADNQFLAIDTKNITLEVDEKYIFESDVTGNFVKYMVWNSSGRISPLAAVRTVNK